MQAGCLFAQRKARLPYHSSYSSLSIGHSTAPLTNVHPISSRLCMLTAAAGVESLQGHDANTLRQPKQPQTATRAPCPDFSFSLHSRMLSPPR